MIRSILITTDFSEASKAPFATAASIARKFRAQLHLLHVGIDPQVVKPWQILEESPEDRARRRAELERRLEGFAAGETALEGLSVRRKVIVEPMAVALEQFLKREKIDLVLIATHGHSAVHHFPLGSFTVKMLQTARCPVLVYREIDDEAHPRSTGLAPRRILVPHDFSRASHEAMAAAHVWADAFGAQVRFITVADSSVVVPTGRALDRFDLQREEARAIRETEEHLDDILLREWRGPHAQTVVRLGNPAVELLKETESWRPDLIVMTSRGLSLYDFATLGSVAERVIYGVGCPVLVVRYQPVLVPEAMA